MAVRRMLPKGVSSLFQGRGGRLRSRPPDNTEAQAFFKIYLRMREKERLARYGETLARSVARIEQHSQKIDAELAASPLIVAALAPSQKPGAAGDVDPREPAAEQRAFVVEY